MSRRWLERLLAGAALAWIGVHPEALAAQAYCPAGGQAFAQVISVQGQVSRNGEPAGLRTLIRAGDTLRVGPRSRAAILLCETDTVFRIDENTVLRFEPRREERSLLNLLRGAIYFFTREPQVLDFRTPFLNAGVKGTEFLLRVVEGEKASLLVIEGTVEMTPVPEAAGLEFDQGMGATLTSGQSAEALPQPAGDERPRVLVQDARLDLTAAVQWTLFYQPVLARATAPSVPEPVRRAADLLAAGRAQEAVGLLQPYRDGGVAQALLAVIAVARNDSARALDHGRRAAALDPDSAAARIALSYAHQANFQLEPAREALQAATRIEPDNALAWARLAELHLAFGHLDRALQAAERAEQLSPRLARTKTVLGFVALARLDASRAIRLFTEALEMDSEDPLPRLGLGLARIHKSRLHEGRRDIEIAVTLDPLNALMRSYLGKAYFEERRSPLAAQAFDFAKRRDPNDPTPWFYDAILKQTQNRPVEGLWSLQESIEHNDNRAVYRSRLLLDRDLAARSASLARIYSDLGFEQLGLVEGFRSVNRDPGNHSAHRFLADTYGTLPRHEIARVSALLRSQLLQPLNITPVQPRLAESDLFILEGSGPAEPGFNEFNPLFKRNRFALQGSGVVGGNDTAGEELVHSGIHDNFSYSVGQFHFETDGFRTNNGQERDIYNAFAQASLSPHTSIQAEYRRSDAEHGDLLLRFDPSNFRASERTDEHVERFRAGLHHAFTPRSEVILSTIFQDREVDFQAMDAVSTLTSDQESSAFTVEGQHLFQGRWVTTITGAGHLDSDAGQLTRIVFAPLPFPLPPIPPVIVTRDRDVTHTNGYLYSLIRLPHDVTLTAGVSFDSFEDQLTDQDQLNPKAGVIWQVTPDTTLRAAGFRVLKRSFIANQTIEPTQVAGFNQFFDDPNGTESWRYGVGVDHRLSNRLYVGVEASARDLDVPFLLVTPAGDVTRRTDWEEQLVRAYAYWTPHPWVAASAEFQYERFDRTRDLPGEIFATDVETYRVPLGLSFFHPEGLMADVRATYVDQEGEFTPIAFTGETMPGSDNFWVFDAALGYRLPKRYGVVSIVVKNVLDESFQFQDTDPGDPRILPERMVFARFTLSF